MERLKKIWAVLLVLVMFTAVPTIIAGCGEENEQDKVEKKLEEGKKELDKALD